MKMRVSRVTKAYALNEILKLTTLERQIVYACYQHRFLTRSQIEHLYFEPDKHLHSSVYTQRVLKRLYTKRFLERLERRIGGINGGSKETVYCLDEAGAYLVALLIGCTKKELKWRSREKLVTDLFLSHTLSINDFMTKLSFYAKRHPPQRLTTFIHDHDCHLDFFHLGKRIKLTPDGYGVYFDGAEYEIYFFLEVDLGTMSPEIFRQKIEKYVSYYLSGAWEEECEIFPKVLIVTVGEKRLSVLKKVTEKVLKKSISHDLIGSIVEFSFTTKERIENQGIIENIWDRAFETRRYSLLD